MNAHRTECNGTGKPAAVSSKRVPPQQRPAMRDDGAAASPAFSLSRILWLFGAQMGVGPCADAVVKRSAPTRGRT